MISQTLFQLYAQTTLSVHFNSMTNKNMSSIVTNNLCLFSRLKTDFLLLL